MAINLPYFDNSQNKPLNLHYKTTPSAEYKDVKILKDSNGTILWTKPIKVLGSTISGVHHEQFIYYDQILEGGEPNPLQSSLGERSINNNDIVIYYKDTLNIKYPNLDYFYGYDDYPCNYNLSTNTQYIDGYGDYCIPLDDFKLEFYNTIEIKLNDFSYACFNAPYLSTATIDDRGSLVATGTLSKDPNSTSNLYSPNYNIVMDMLPKKEWNNISFYLSYKLTRTAPPYHDTQHDILTDKYPFTSKEWETDYNYRSDIINVYLEPETVKNVSWGDTCTFKIYLRWYWGKGEFITYDTDVSETISIPVSESIGADYDYIEKEITRL